MADHATLSASSAERWINCPGSVHMASLFPGSTSSAAEEGTLAHELGAALIDNRSDKKALAKVKKEIKKKVDDFYKDHPEINDDYKSMEDNVSGYADFVIAKYEELKKRDPAAILITEQRVDYSHIVKGGFGTSDAVIIGDNTVIIIDLKYGKGVEVPAENNPQMRLYALGAMSEFELLYDFDAVEMTIYQPRRSNISSELMYSGDLTEWAREVVKPAADKALSDNPPYHPGEWCTNHFCPGAGVCKARAEYVLAMERHSGKDPALLSDEELADALNRSTMLASWAKALGAYALDSALSGHRIPGYKVVEGRSNRAYKNADKAADAIMAAGFDEAMIYNKTLLGITDMEKLMGKKKFAEVLKDLVIKPKGAPKLVPESDKREMYRDSVKNEFD